MSNVLDFDAFRAEQHEEPLEVKVGGEIFLLPASPPARIAMDILRRMEDAEDADKVRVSPREVPRLAVQLFGQDMYDALLDRHHLSVNELGFLIQQVLARYQEGAAPPPNRAIRRARRPRNRSTSSAPGRSSRPTSSASTGSTSAAL